MALNRVAHAPSLPVPGGGERVADGEHVVFPYRPR